MQDLQKNAVSQFGALREPQFLVHEDELAKVWEVVALEVFLGLRTLEVGLLEVRTEVHLLQQLQRNLQLWNSLRLIFWAY